MLIKAIVKYDGSHYYGWQSQNSQTDIKTVAGVINRVVSKINKRPTQVVASGRTDRKVHALGQVFHFHNDHNIDLKRLKNALNNALPDDIEIVDVEQVNDDFHARFSARSKEYHYYLNLGKFNLFEKDYITQYNKKLDYQLMVEAAKYFIGKHDFRSFNATPLAEKNNQVRTISKFKILQKDNLLIFQIEGDSFLRHMARMMVGTIIYIGARKYTIDDLNKLLNNKESTLAPFNAKPNGLYLVKVNY